MIITQDIKNYTDRDGVLVVYTKESATALINEGLGARGYTIVKITKLKNGYCFYLKTPGSN